jgi:hypothetical protein
MPNYASIHLKNQDFLVLLHTFGLIKISTFSTYFSQQFLFNIFKKDFLKRKFGQKFKISEHFFFLIFLIKV